MFNLQNAILPTPVKILDGKQKVSIGTIASPDCFVDYTAGSDVYNSAVDVIRASFEKVMFSFPGAGRFKITLSVNPSDLRFGTNAKPESYLISITDTEASLVGFDDAGAYYAAVSFASLVHSEASDVFVPVCEILDYPHFEKRGHFMECRYGSDFMTLDDWKKGIDYLSQMKINTIVTGLYGCWNRQFDGEFAEYQYIPFKKYPQLKTPRHIKYYSAKERSYIYKKDVLPVMYETDYFGDMIAYGKTKNVKVIPLFNSLGHNTLIPRLFPEVSAVDEDGTFRGVGFCTNNEKTYEIMFDIYDEIIDRYLAPNGIDAFEIGLDEVHDVLGTDPSDYQISKSPICQCPKCRGRNYGELMIEYIIKITKYLNSRGIKDVYVYHDMLLHHDLLNESTAELFKKEGVYDSVIIDWWSYNTKPAFFGGKPERVNNLFRSVGKPMTGYYHWCQPMEATENMLLMKDLAIKNNFEGIISYSSFDYGYDFNYRLFAETCWNPDCASDPGTLEKYVSIVFPECYSEALAAIKTAHSYMSSYDRNVNLVMYVFSYYIYSYLYKDTEYPEDYPAKVFRKMAEDEAMYLDSLSNIYYKAKAVRDFFETNTSSRQGRQWQFSASIYMSVCDEFHTIYTCAKEYNKGTISAEKFVSELDRVIKSSDKTIALCEDVRIKANQYTIIRNMSVTRQCVCDLRDYINSELKKGNKPEIDIFNFDKYLSDVSRFLR
ncbi:MAG: family 20 glycosylhydrolase [Clostridia bacterium]|nr:family 20 glycosylhydrolase [Clostridia bacterium]